MNLFVSVREARRGGEADRGPTIEKLPVFFVDLGTASARVQADADITRPVWSIDFSDKNHRRVIFRHRKVRESVLRRVLVAVRQR